MVLLYVTFPGLRAAEAAALSVLSKRLAACVNIFPCRSAYLWKGRVVREKEFIGLFKTTKARVAAAKAAIISVHPYDVPCVLELPEKANAAFGKWVRAELG